MDTYKFPTDHLLPPDQLPANKAPALIVTCGSYNPIHESHIESFAAARKAIESSEHGKEIEICGAFLSPVNDGYKKAGLAPFNHRLAMCELALKEHKWLNVDAWEGLQEGFTRSYYVLHHAQEEAAKLYGRADVRIYFLCGADLFETFYRPNCWELKLLSKIFTEFHLCVIKRVGSEDPTEVIAKGIEPLTNDKEPGVSLDLTQFLDKITVAEITPNETSSTKIRDAIKAADWERLGELVPAACVPYLKEHDVYPSA